MAVNLTTLQEKLQPQIEKEYGLGFNYIRTERERKREILQKVLDPNIPKGQVRVHLLWRNIQLEQALFLNDEISVKLLMEDGIV